MKLTQDELNKLPKDAIILLYQQIADSFALLSDQNQMIQEQNKQLLLRVADMQEQIAILTQNRFGKKTETNKQISGQLSIDLENMCVLNDTSQNMPSVCHLYNTAFEKRFE